MRTRWTQLTQSCVPACQGCRATPSLQCVSTIPCGISQPVLQVVTKLLLLGIHTYSGHRFAFPASAKATISEPSNVSFRHPGIPCGVTSDWQIHFVASGVRKRFLLMQHPEVAGQREGSSDLSEILFWQQLSENTSHRREKVLGAVYVLAISHKHTFPSQKNQGMQMRKAPFTLTYLLELGRGRDRQRWTSAGSLPEWPGLSHVESMKRSFFHVSYMGGKGPNTRAVFHCLSQVVGRHLYQTWSTWDTAGTHRECPPCRWQLYLFCHHIGSGLLIVIPSISLVKLLFHILVTLHPFSVEDLVPKEDNFYPRTQLYSIKLEVEAAFWPSGLLPVSE